MVLDSISFSTLTMDTCVLTLNLGNTPPPRVPQRLVLQSTVAKSGFGHSRMQTYMVAAMCQQAHSNSTCVHTHLTGDSETIPVLSASRQENTAAFTDQLKHGHLLNVWALLREQKELLLCLPTVSTAKLIMPPVTWSLARKLEGFVEGLML